MSIGERLQGITHNLEIGAIEPTSKQNDNERNNVVVA